MRYLHDTAYKFSEGMVERLVMELIYKRLEQSEISMCADTLIKAFKEEPWNEEWTFEQACTRLDELMSARVSRGYIVLDSEKKIVVGMVIGRIMTYLSKKELWLDEVSIHPDYQRKGIGTRMLEYVRGELKAEPEEISYIVLTTGRGYPSVSFYEKNGFRTDENIIFMEGAVR